MSAGWVSCLLLPLPLGGLAGAPVAAAAHGPPLEARATPHRPVDPAGLAGTHPTGTTTKTPDLPGQGAPPRVVTPDTASTWWRVAVCEERGANNALDGYLGILPGTWVAYGGGGGAPPP